jgi:K+-transporting ATPase KdpF subunit
MLTDIYIAAAVIAVILAIYLVICLLTPEII